MTTIPKDRVSFKTQTGTLAVTVPGRDGPETIKIKCMTREQADAYLAWLDEIGVLLSHNRLP